MSETSPGRARSWMSTLRLALIAVVLAADAMFVAQNYVEADLRFLWWRWETHLSWLPVVLLAPGIVIGWLIPRRRWWRQDEASTG